MIFSDRNITVYFITNDNSKLRKEDSFIDNRYGQIYGQLDPGPVGLKQCGSPDEAGQMERHNTIVMLLS